MLQTAARCSQSLMLQGLAFWVTIIRDASRNEYYRRSSSIPKNHWECNERPKSEMSCFRCGHKSQACDSSFHFPATTPRRVVKKHWQLELIRVGFDSWVFWLSGGGVVTAKTVRNIFIIDIRVTVAPSLFLVHFVWRGPPLAKKRTTQCHIFSFYTLIHSTNVRI